MLSTTLRSRNTQRELGLNVKQFELDFNSEKTAAEVRKDMADGESYGINGNAHDLCKRRSGTQPVGRRFPAAIDKALGKQ